MTIAKQELKFTASMGVTERSETAHSHHELIALAREAAGEARQAAAHQLRFYDVSGSPPAIS